MTRVGSQRHRKKIYLEVSLEILNLIDILTTNMKSKHIMYQQYWTYPSVCVCVCVCVPY